MGRSPPANPSLFELCDVGRGMTSTTGDVRDLASLRSAFRQANPEVVIHLAAKPLVRTASDDPVETYSTNVLGTVHLLEAVRDSSRVRAVVMITSDKCYENREWFWSYREKSSLGGSDPYRSSKACAEMTIHAYRCSFYSPQKYEEHGVALASARAGNVIGGLKAVAFPPPERSNQPRILPDVGGRG